MKSFFVQTLKLALIGSTLFAPSLLSAPKALALPQEKVLEKLSSIPVFIVTDAQGVPAGVSRTQGKPLVKAFISEYDAETFSKSIQRSDPALINKLKVSPLSLADVYKISLDNKSKPDSWEFTVIPVETEVNAAKKLLNVKDFSGVPLFLIKNGKNNGYFTINQGEGRKVIRCFFEIYVLQLMLNKIKTEQPSLAPDLQIEVITLEKVMKILAEKDGEAVNSLELVRPR